MIIHKDIIIRLIFSFIFIAITFRVLGPIILDFFKKKLPGQYAHENDIDSMIRKQKERLRAQYGLYGDVESNQENRLKSNDGHKKLKNETSPQLHDSLEIQQISKEIIWGGGIF